MWLKQFLIILFGWHTFVLIASVNSGLICFQYFSTHEDNNGNGRSMNTYKQNQIFSHDKLHFSSVIFYSKLVTFCQLGNWNLYRIKIIDLSLQIQNFVIFCMLLFCIKWWTNSVVFQKKTVVYATLWIVNWIAMDG